MFESKLNKNIAWGYVGLDGDTKVPLKYLPDIPFSKIISRPTTVAGYGITDAVPTSRTLTINGVTLDLSTDRAWSITTSPWTVTGSGALVSSDAALNAGGSGSGAYAILGGFLAGLATTGSNYMVALGYQAGGSSGNAPDMITIGRNSGNNAANASNSIFIGQDAGKNQNANTSISIGWGANTGGFSNSISIGTNAINTKANQFLVGSTYTNLNFRGIDYAMPTSQGVAGGVLTISSVTSGTASLVWTDMNAFGWKITGNTGINPSTNFIGTINNSDLAFRAFNSEAMRIFAGTGNISIGSGSDIAKLYVNGSIKFNNLTQNQNGIFFNFINGGYMSSNVGDINFMSIYNPSSQEMLRLDNSGIFILGVNTKGAIVNDGNNRIIINGRDTTAVQITQRYNTSALAGGDRTIALIENAFDTVTGGGELIGLNIAMRTVGFTAYTALKTVTGDVYFNTTSGNTTIGSSSNGGFKLDINGTARVTGTLTLGSALLAASNSPGSSGNVLVSQGAGTPPQWVAASTIGGVTSVTGTTDQITASPTTGNVVVSLPSTVKISGSLWLGGSGQSIQWGSGGSFLTLVSDGVFRLGDSTGGGSPRIIMGSNSASFVSLLRNGTALDIKLGDNSGYGNARAAAFITNGGTTSQYVTGTGSLITFPTNVSSFTNDSGFITATSTDTLTNKTLSSPLLTGVSGASYAQGKLIYDTDNESLTFFNNDSNVGLQVGQENWIRVKNVSGSTIANGAAVYINGSDAGSGLPTIALAKADVGSTSVCAGLATEAIANNAIGYVTCLGVVNGIDTSAFTTGIVYVSETTAGALTQTAPTSPNYRYRVGFVTVVSATVGKIHVTQSTAMLGNGANGTVLSIASGVQAFQSIATILGYTPSNDSNVVHLTGTETITGAKTFTTNNVVFGSSTYDMTNTRWGINTSPSARLHILTTGLGITATDTSGILLENTSPASSGAAQLSPAILMSANGYNTGAASSQNVKLRLDMLTVENATTPVLTYRGQYNTNATGYTDLFAFSKAINSSSGLVSLALAGNTVIGNVSGTINVYQGVNGFRFLSSNGTVVYGQHNLGNWTWTPQSLTSSQSTTFWAATQTWNTTGTPTGMSYAITNTASNAASLVFNYLAGSGGTTSLLALRIDGNLGINTATPDAKLKLVSTALGVTPADSSGIYLSTAGVAASGTQQLSPSLLFEGFGWGTTLGTSQSQKWRMDVLPVQGSGALSNFRLGASFNGGAYTDALVIDYGTFGSANVALKLNSSIILGRSGSQNQVFTGTSNLTFFDSAGAVALGSVTAAGLWSFTPSSFTTAATLTAWNVTQTWNNSSGVYTGFKVNITNTASAATSRLLDLQLASTSVFSVSTATTVITSGTITGVSISHSFAPTSGTATFAALSMTPTINQTGVTGSPITRGLYINPTLTAALDFRGIELTNGSVAMPWKAVSATYSILNNDYCLEFTTGTFTATLPTAVGCAGREYELKNTGTGVITIATTSSQTIDGVTTYSLSAQYKYVKVRSNGTNWIIVANN